MRETLDQAVNIASATNARELGGYFNKNGKQIRKGKLLRSGHLNTLSSEDIQTLQNTYHLHTIIDFRSSQEIKHEPDQEIPGTQNIWIPILPETMNHDDNQVLHSEDTFENIYRLVQNPAFDAKDFYVNIMKQDIAVKGYRRFFDCLLALPEDRSVLWHCTAGKDRTGMAAMFLLAVLDVDKTTIMNDYLLTNLFNQDLISEFMKTAKQRTDDEEILMKLQGFHGVLQISADTLIAYCEQKHGSLKKFVQEEIGISDREIEQLQAEFLI